MYGLQSQQVQGGGYAGTSMPKPPPTVSIAPVLNKYIVEKFPKDYRVRGGRRLTVHGPIKSMHMTMLPLHRDLACLQSLPRLLVCSC